MAEGGKLAGEANESPLGAAAGQRGDEERELQGSTTSDFDQDGAGGKASSHTETRRSPMHAVALDGHRARSPSLRMKSALGLSG
jgi:hypothetical protein